MAELERQRQAEAERQKQAEHEARLAKIREERERLRAEEEARRQGQARQERLAKIQEQRERIQQEEERARQAAAAAAARQQAEELQIKFKEYYDAVSKDIRDQWIVPEWVRRRNVEILVSVRIGRDGRILSTTIEKRSGDPALDDSVVKALEKAKQRGLPPLPDGYTNSELEFGLIFNPSTQL